jgi:hypothetical protein
LAVAVVQQRRPVARRDVVGVHVDRAGRAHAVMLVTQSKRVST